MPSLINGIGTAYFGRCKQRTDGSYVTTEFVVFLYFPLVPLRSCRVRPIGPATEFYLRQWYQSTESSSQNYEVSAAPLEFRQVVGAYFVTFCKFVTVALSYLLFFAAIVNAASIAFTAEALTAKLWAAGLNVSVAIGAVGLLYWILISRRPRPFERIQ
jgi:hypothetical protein